MPRGRRSSYTRDNRGRFASSPGGGAPKRSTPATRRAATRAGNRLNRDNAGRISGIGRNGATVRGGRLKTAKGNRRATQLASMKAAGFRGGTIAKGGRGIRGSVARSLAAVRKERMAAAKPAAAGSVRTVNRTRAEAAAAYKKRIRPARAAAARMAPADKPVSVSRPDGNLIVGKTWEQIQAAQRGSKRALNGGPMTGKLQKPKATQGDRRLLAQKGMKGLKAEGMDGALDRLRTSKVRIGGKPKSSAGIRKPPSATKPAAKKAAKGPKVKLPRMATPTGVIRGSDRAKVKADAQKGIGTPYSRASQRAIDRSAREAPLQRKQAIAAAKRKGRTGFGKGAQMNAGSIGNRDFAWNKNETPATARERLAMWRKSEQRRRGNARRGSIGVKGAAGALRASRRAAALVDSGNRLGSLPTTRKMAEQPRQRRNDRISRNETQGRLASSEASRRLLPQIQKVRDAAQKRIAEGKKPTAAQKEKERKLVGEYNKAVRKLQVAEAAKSYMQNPYGFKPQRMSGAVKAKPTAPKRTRSARPAGTVAKPRGMRPGVLAGRRGVKAKLTGKGRAPGSRLVKPVKQADGSFDVNGRPAKTMQDAMRVLRQQRAQEKERALSAKRIDANKRVERADLRAVEKGTGKRAANAYARENAIYRFGQKEDQASKRADQVATKGKALEAEYTRLTRKPASKANDKRIQEVKSQITRLRRSFETLLKASKSYKQRGLDVRRPFPRIYK